MLLEEVDRFSKTKSQSSSRIHITKASLKRFASFLKLAKTHPHHTQLNLQSFLILPVQRLPRYKLLLGEILKYTNVDHPDYSFCARAMDNVETLIRDCNEKKREIEDFRESQTIFTRIFIPADHRQDARAALLSAGGKFQKEGQLRLLKMTELGQAPGFPVVDPMIACNGKKMKFSQHRILDLCETRFGAVEASPFWESGSSHDNLDSSSSRDIRTGKVFYFFKFKQILCWCRRRTDLLGSHEVIAILPIKDVDLIDSSQDLCILRIRSTRCILYLQGSDLNLWI